MVEISVSKENYEALLKAPYGEEVLVRHTENGRKVGMGALLHKRTNIECPIEMTIEQIEKRLGHKVKIVGGKQ